MAQAIILVSLWTTWIRLEYVEDYNYPQAEHTTSCESFILSVIIPGSAEFLSLDWIFDDTAMCDQLVNGNVGKRIKAGLNERKGQYCKHAIHCFNLVYRRCLFSPRRCITDARRGMLFNIYHHCLLLTSPCRVTWWPSNNSNTGSPTPNPRLLSMVNLSATSRNFPNAMH